MAKRFRTDPTASQAGAVSWAVVACVVDCMAHAAGQVGRMSSAAGESAVAAVDFAVAVAVEGDMVVDAELVRENNYSVHMIVVVTDKREEAGGSACSIARMAERERGRLAKRGFYRY